MQKDEICVSCSGEGRLRANPVDPSLLFCDFACCFSFRSIAFSALVLLQSSLRDQQSAIKQLADDIGEVHMSFSLKQIVDGVWNRLWGSDLVGGSKGGTDIATPVPGY